MQRVTAKPNRQPNLVAHEAETKQSTWCITKQSEHSTEGQTFVRCAVAAVRPSWLGCVAEWWRPGLQLACKSQRRHSNLQQYSTQVYSPWKTTQIKKQNHEKSSKTKHFATLPVKSHTTAHSIILGLILSIFSTQSTNDIIGYGEFAQKSRFSIIYAHLDDAHRRQWTIKHFHTAACRSLFGSWTFSWLRLQLYIPKTWSRPMREGKLLGRLGRNTVMASIYFLAIQQ